MAAIVMVVAGAIALVICFAGLALSILQLLYHLVGLRLMACLALVLWFAYHAAPLDQKPTPPRDPGPRPYACSLCVVPK